MNTIAKRLPSPAMLVACVALVVALGGVGYAAAVLPAGSINTKQLRLARTLAGDELRVAVQASDRHGGHQFAAMAGRIHVAK
jgi:hypothetical protein